MCRNPSQDSLFKQAVVDAINGGSFVVVAAGNDGAELTGRTASGDQPVYYVEPAGFGAEARRYVDSVFI